MTFFKWRIGQVRIFVKKHCMFTRVKEADQSSLTLNKSQLTPITVDWVFSGSRASLWREFSLLSRQGGLSPQNDPWTMRQWGDESSLLCSMLPPHWLVAPHTSYPVWYCRHKSRTETLGSPVGPELAKGASRDSDFQGRFLIHITNALKETHWLLAEKLYKSMNEDQWCQHKHWSLGDYMSYIVLLLVIKNSQCFYNLHHVPNTVLRTCIELIN